MDTLFVALRVIVSLAVVVGLLWMIQRRLAKGTKRQRSSKLVNVVSRQGIAQKASVVVVDMEGKRFLLGVTEHSVTVLDATEVAAFAEAPVAEAPVAEVAVAEALEAAPVEAAPSRTSGTGVEAAPSRTSGTGVAAAPSRTSGTGVAAKPSFAAALTAAKKNPVPASFTSFNPKTGQPKVGVLDGSIISFSTWRRAASALRGSK